MSKTSFEFELLHTGGELEQLGIPGTSSPARDARNVELLQSRFSAVLSRFVVPVVEPVMRQGYAEPGWTLHQLRHSAITERVGRLMSMP
jgi:hypothetical protein